MNCDHIFNILTRGPFPSGDSTDAAVEIHLSLCADCRHIADALRPDSGAEDEMLLPEESRGLPYYWGIAALGEHGNGTQVTTAKNRRTRRKRATTFFEKHEPLAHLSGWQLAFAVLMGAALGTLLKLLGYVDGGDTPARSVAQVTPAMTASESFDPRQPSQVPSDVNRQLAAKLGATPACWEDQHPLPGFESRSPGAHDPLSPVAIHEELCCTKCHNATSPRFALRATTAKIVRSCQVCHEETAPHEVSLR